MEGVFQGDEASSATLSCVGSAALFATCNHALVQATCRAPGPCIYQLVNLWSQLILQ